MDTARDYAMPSEAVLERIDVILRELLELRQTVTSHGRATRGNATAQLFATLGHGTWEEYDLDADWQRFES
jgi:hypothetical protein